MHTVIRSEATYLLFFPNIFWWIQKPSEKYLLIVFGSQKTKNQKKSIVPSPWNIYV